MFSKTTSQRLKTIFKGDDSFGLWEFLYYAFKPLGLLPLKRWRNGNGDYVYDKSNFDTIQITLNVILNISFHLWLFTLPDETVAEKIILCVGCTQSFMFSVQPFRMYLKRHQFYMLFHKMNKVDKLFRKVGIFFSNTWYHIISILMTIFASMIVVSFTLIVYHFFGRSLIIRTSSLIQTFFYVHNMISIYFYCSFNSVIVIRIHYLNTFLVEGEFLKMANLVEMGKEKISDVLRVCADLHYRLCELAEMIHNIYSYMVLGNIFGTSMIIVLVLVSDITGAFVSRNELIFYSFSEITMTWLIIVSLDYMTITVSILLNHNYQLTNYFNKKTH